MDRADALEKALVVDLTPRGLDASRPTRSSRPPRCFSPRSSTLPDRGERVHRRSAVQTSG